MARRGRLPDDLITTIEAADLLGMLPWQVERGVQAGRLHPYYIGPLRTPRYRFAQILDGLAAGLFPPAPPAPGYDPAACPRCGEAVSFAPLRRAGHLRLVEHDGVPHRSFCRKDTSIG